MVDKCHCCCHYYYNLCIEAHIPAGWCHIRVSDMPPTVWSVGNSGILHNSSHRGPHAIIEPCVQTSPRVGQGARYHTRHLIITDPSPSLEWSQGRANASIGLYGYLAFYAVRDVSLLVESFGTQISNSHHAIIVLCGVGELHDIPLGSRLRR